MKFILPFLSIIGLILTIAPSILYFAGHIDSSTHKQWMFIGTILWFITAPFWMNKSKPEEEEA